MVFIWPMAPSNKGSSPHRVGWTCYIEFRWLQVCTQWSVPPWWLWIIAEDEYLFLKLNFVSHPDKMKMVERLHARGGAGYTWSVELFILLRLCHGMESTCSSRDLSMAIGAEEAAVTIRDYIENFRVRSLSLNFYEGIFDCVPTTGVPDNNARSMSEWRESCCGWSRLTIQSTSDFAWERWARRVTLTPQDEISTNNGRQKRSCPNCWLDDGGWVGDRTVVGWETMWLSIWKSTIGIPASVYIVCDGCSNFTVPFVCRDFIEGRKSRHSLGSADFSTRRKLEAEAVREDS
jgi:hypothetical protein